MSVRRPPEIRKVRTSIDGRVSREDNPAEQERHRRGHTQHAWFKRRVERRLLPLRSTRHPSRPLAVHQRDHFGVIEQPTLRRTLPVRTCDDLIVENQHRADRKLIEVETPACFRQRLHHESLITRTQ